MVVIPPPYGWRDGDGNKHGVGWHIVRDLLASVGYEAVAYPLDYRDPLAWKKLVVAMENGSVAAISAMTLLRSPPDIFEYLEEPLFTINIGLYISSKKNIPYSGLASLSGYKGLWVSSTDGASFNGVVQDQGLSIDYEPDYGVALTAVNNGDADYMIAAAGASRVHIRLHRYQDKIIEIDDYDELPKIPIYLVLSKLSPLYRARAELSKALSKYNIEGKSERLKIQYMKQYIRNADRDAIK